MGPIWSNGQKSNLVAKIQRISTRGRPCNTMSQVRRLMPRLRSLTRLDTTKSKEINTQTIPWWEHLIIIIHNIVRIKAIDSTNILMATTTTICTDRFMAKRLVVWDPMAIVPLERPVRYKADTWTTLVIHPNWPLKDAGSNSKMVDRTNPRMAKLAQL